LSFVVEPEKRIPVLYDVDVAVAGGGLSGVFAALAAARHGAETLVIDRFGSLGGHLGPGMVIGATPGLIPELTETLGSGFYATPKGLIDRVEKLRGDSLRTTRMTPACSPMWR